MDTAKLFWQGQNQAVRLPETFRLQGEKVYIKRVGNAIVLLPFDAPWQTLVNSLDLFSADFMNERDQLTFEDRESAWE